MTQQSELSEPFRQLIFAVDSHGESLDQLLLRGWRQTDLPKLGEFVEEIVSTALYRRELTDDQVPFEPSPSQFATGFVSAAIRAEHSTPFESGNDPYSRKTNIDVEQPLRKNPGGSAVLSRLRSLFQDQICNFFDDNIGIQRLTAQVLLGPTSEDPIFIEEDGDSIIRKVSFRSASNGIKYVRLPEDLGTRWDRILPQSVSGDTFPPIRKEGGSVFVPVPIVRAKLREYAGHSFDRLVFRGHQQFQDWRHQALKKVSWQIEKDIYDKFHTNNIKSLYGERRYDSGGTTQRTKSENTSFHPVVHDQRMANIVDVIRATEELLFSKYHTAREIYEAALTVYPAPHRPPNNLRSVQRIAQVLRSAADSDGITIANVDRRDRRTDSGTTSEYRIAEPRHSPFYSCPRNNNKGHRWDAYRRLRARYSAIPLTDEAQIDPAVRAAAGTDDDPLLEAKRHADKLAVTQPHSRSLNEIDPAVRPTDLDLDVNLSREEIRVLTRIVYTQLGLLRGRTLLDGMTDITRIEGNDFADDLISKGILNRYDKGYHTLYSVPSDVVEALGLDEPSHETYGEFSGETILHRYGIALLAADLKQREDVDEVRRYLDLWRIDVDAALDRVAAETSLEEVDPDSLHRRRVDVAAFSDGELQYVGEVQLAHGNHDRVRRNWEKLRILAEHDATAVWLAVDSDGLTSILSTLQQTGCINAGESLSSESVEAWRNSFESKNRFNRGIREFHTFKSLYRGNLS